MLHAGIAAGARVGWNRLPGVRNRLVPVLGMLGILMAAACSTTVTGTASVLDTPTSGRTIGTPSAADPTRTSVTDPSTTVPSTTVPSSAEATGTDPSTADPSTADPSSGEATGGPATGVPEELYGPIDLGPSSDGFLFFRTPSGNISCGMIDTVDFGSARCDVVEHTYPDPPTPECDVVGVSTGSAEVGADGPGVVGICAGDTVADPAAPVLQYGTNAGAGPYVCRSAEDGVTCANLDTGHGFQIARASYRVF